MTNKRQAITEQRLIGLSFRRPLSNERIPVPTVTLVDSELHWIIAPPPVLRFPDAGLLSDFEQFADADASEKKILRFAQSWGVLRVCEHGFPAGHRRFEDTPMGRVLLSCPTVGANVFHGREPIHVWRKQARRFRTLIRLAAEIADGMQGDEADWEALGVVREEMEPWGRGLGGPRHKLEFLVRQLSLEADLQVNFHWPIDKARAEVTFGGTGLFGALVAQLVLELSLQEGLLICAVCGREFTTRGRGRRHGERAYCKKCRRRGEPVKMASHAYREAKNRALDLRAAGRTIEYIAKELGREESVIMGWVGDRIRHRRNRRKQLIGPTWGDRYRGTRVAATPEQRG